MEKIFHLHDELLVIEQDLDKGTGKVTKEKKRILRKSNGLHINLVALVAEAIFLTGSALEQKFPMAVKEKEIEEEISRFNQNLIGLAFASRGTLGKIKSKLGQNLAEYEKNGVIEKGENDLETAVLDEHQKVSSSLIEVKERLRQDLGPEERSYLLQTKNLLYLEQFLLLAEQMQPLVTALLFFDTMSTRPAEKVFLRLMGELKDGLLQVRQRQVGTKELSWLKKLEHIMEQVMLRRKKMGELKQTVSCVQGKVRIEVRVTYKKNEQYPKINFVVLGRKEKRMCLFCKKEGKGYKLCSRCKRAYYCGSTCQKRDWNRHKGECKKSGT